MDIWMGWRIQIRAAGKSWMFLACGGSTLMFENTFDACDHAHDQLPGGVDFKIIDPQGKVDGIGISGQP